MLSFRCTHNDELVKCSKNASSFHIIPPIVSAKLTTKNHLFSRYGELEVIADLPTGDWIVSGKHENHRYC